MSVRRAAEEETSSVPVMVGAGGAAEIAGSIDGCAAMILVGLGNISGGSGVSCWAGFSIAGGVLAAVELDMEEGGKDEDDDDDDNEDEVEVEIELELDEDVSDVDVELEAPGTASICTNFGTAVHLLPLRVVIDAMIVNYEKAIPVANRTRNN